MILVINSPQEFYSKLLQERKNYKGLQAFIDNMRLFLDGCPCDSERHWEYVLQEYRHFKRQDFTQIKQDFGFDKIQFNLDNQILFSV